MATGSVWGEFALDPREEQYAGLRASDADRDVVHRALGSAYAEGRLTREEFDQRSEAVLGARALGELPILLVDLVPPAGLPAPRAEAGLPEPGLAERAVEEYRSDRREALWAFVSASLICWVIWGVTIGPGGFPWPVFVMLGTGMHLLRLVVMRDAEVAQRRRSLERKAASTPQDPPSRELGA